MKKLAPFTIPLSCLLFNAFLPPFQRNMGRTKQDTLATAKKEMSSKQPNRIVVGVDDAHAESRYALEAAETFANPSRDKVTMFSVVSKTSVNSDMRAELEKTYRSYAFEMLCSIEWADADASASIAEAFLKEAALEKAALLCLGVGHIGALGSLSDELLRSAYCNVLVARGQHSKHKFDARKPGGARLFLYAVSGTQANMKGLEDFCATWLKKNDRVILATCSHYDGDKDKAILAESEAKARQVTGGGDNVSSQFSTRWIQRLRGESVGTQICEVAEKEDVTCVVLPTAHLTGEEKNRIGSTCACVADKCSQSVLVLKVVLTHNTN